MTGHGRGTASIGGVRVSAEIAGLNRKNLDIACNLPRELAAFDLRAREMIAAAIHRGRVSLSMTLEHASPPPPERLVDADLARAYLAAIRAAQRSLGLPGNVTISDLLALPGVAGAAALAPDPARLLPVCEAALSAALKEFCAMRHREGAALQRELAARSAKIARHLRPILKENAEAIRSRTETLRGKVAMALGMPHTSGNQPPDERLLKEALLIAERADIAEEIARIESHLAQFKTALESGDAVGRQLDFLAQEMGREFHTLGAKTASAEVSRRVIACKIEVERLREQVQNIE